MGCGEGATHSRVYLKDEWSEKFNETRAVRGDFDVNESGTEASLWRRMLECMENKNGKLECFLFFGAAGCGLGSS